jgi:hypothetical protein
MKMPIFVKFAGFGGAEGDRTPDLLIANEALSQLSYGPRQSATEFKFVARFCE